MEKIHWEQLGDGNAEEHGKTTSWHHCPSICASILLWPKMNNNPVYGPLKLKVRHTAMFLHAIISHTNWTKVSFTCFSCRYSTEAFNMN